MKKVLIPAVITAILGPSSVFAADNSVNSGHVNFYGMVTDVSCTVSADGQGSDASIYVPAISLSEIQENNSNTYLKPKSFVIDLTNCQAAGSDLNIADVISVVWTGGNLFNNASGDSLGYLANTDSTGSQNVYFALSTDSDSSLQNKIIPGDMSQPSAIADTVTIPNGARFTYYVGYVSEMPQDATSGLLNSYATYEITYQ